jgi:leucyl aminopeptidase
VTASSEPLAFAPSSPEARAICFLDAAGFAALERTLSASLRAQLGASGFAFAPGKFVVLADEGGVETFFCIEDAAAPGRERFAAGQLANLAPQGVWRLEGASEEDALAALLGAYKFTRYKPAKTPSPRFVAPAGVDAARIERIAQAVALGRDLINTPANDLGPAELEAAARALAARHDAKVETVAGAALAEGFPLIEIVGRASVRAPRLVDLRLGEEGPRVTLVGKGVCYDTGGLDIKPSSAMALMKKDMGGAAAALAAADMLMGDMREGRGPKIRLRVLLPIVENSVSGSAFRTGDVYRSRKGLTVEIGNTDAEGRLILADALAYACEEAPDLLIDFATLTGAARVALGPQLPPLYSDDEALANAMLAAGGAVDDPVWRMPLHGPYDKMLDSKIADLNSAPGGGMAGSITAALFLRRFAQGAAAWAHLDIYGWTPSARPGRPEGGEPQAARLVHRLICERYGAAGGAA